MIVQIKAIAVDFEVDFFNAPCEILDLNAAAQRDGELWVKRYHLREKGVLEEMVAPRDFVTLGEEFNKGVGCRMNGKLSIYLFAQGFQLGFPPTQEFMMLMTGMGKKPDLSHRVNRFLLGDTSSHESLEKY